MKENDSQNEAKEKKRLKDTIEIVESEFEDTEKSLKNLSMNASNKDPYLLQSLSKIYSERLEKLQKAKSKPYFARIDFQEHGGEKEELYIGKSNIMDEDNQSIVIDWRAPVSSLYYDGRLGKVSYEAPIGIIEGDLSLKRVYEIENGELESFSDVDISSNDELLKPYLSSNSDARLKNIISTIQTEQNKIIRAPLNTPLIVQGVAGSGKTTVALHRIAYLAYAYEKQLKSDDFMIIAPNKFFLDYISAILPDLGVNDVEQVTFEEFAQNIIGTKLKIENSHDKLSNIVNTGKTGDNLDLVQNIATLKSSACFKEALEKYLQDLESNYLPSTDIKVNDYTLLSHEKLVEKFKETKIGDKSLEERTKIFKNRLSVFFENNESKIYDLLRKKRKSEIDQINNDLSETEYQKVRKEIFDKYNNDFELIKNGGKKLVAQYIKSINKSNALDYYKDFISKLDYYMSKDSSKNKELIDQIQFNLLSNKNNKSVEYEDLAPLMYIASKIQATKKNISTNEKIPKHIVIDEAQDYSPFQFFVLKEILNNNSMTILGDIAQGIYSYRGTKDWNDVNAEVFGGNAKVLQLSKSYRTTMEIMEKGNDVISNINDRINIGLAEPVIRKGIPVNIEKKNSNVDEISSIENRLNELEKIGHKNIAVITKTLDEAKDMLKKFNKKGIESNLISDKENEYKGGVTIIPSYLTKGLEFDSVIIANANKQEYGNNELDAKLLYIAITRAMHTLDIYYTGERSELLNERLKVDNTANSKCSINELEER